MAPWVLLPMRFFFGGMFLYAGLDKLLDPSFLRPTGIGSIGEQLQGFMQVSPLAPLIAVTALPFPVLVGFGIALLEIAIGIGTILGLLYRAAALAGMALSLLFFLTASWDTRPFYLGADLPYLFGWLTLALAGDGGLLSVDAWLRRREEAAAPAFAPDGWRRADRRVVGGRPMQPAGSASDALEMGETSRRRFLELGILAMASVAVAGLAIASPFRERLDPSLASAPGSAGPDPGTLGQTGSATSNPPLGTSTPAAPTTSATPGASPSPAASTLAPSATPAGTLLGKLDQVPVGSAATFQDPSSGEPAILVRLGSSTCVAYDALCTHEGCEVDYDAGQKVLFCPCHGAVFDAAHGAKVLRGPARRPLPELPLRIDPATGSIYLET